MKKFIIFLYTSIIINICIILSGCTKDIYTAHEVSVINKSVEILDLYYSPHSLCVSDSVYHLEWYASDILDSTTNKRIFEIIDSLPSTQEKPIFSTLLHKNFEKNFNSHDCYKFMAKFSRPYSRSTYSQPSAKMLRCDIVTLNQNHSDSIDNAEHSKYLIKYDKNGLYQITKLETTITLQETETLE